MGHQSWNHLTGFDYNLKPPFFEKIAIYDLNVIFDQFRLWLQIL